MPQKDGVCAMVCACFPGTIFFQEHMCFFFHQGPSVSMTQPCGLDLHLRTVWKYIYIYTRTINWLVVSTHLKNMLVKLDHFHRYRGENSQKYLKPPPGKSFQPKNCQTPQPWAKKTSLPIFWPFFVLDLKM